MGASLDMLDGNDVARPSRLRAADGILFAALLAAFSPTLKHLVEHWIQDPWSAYSAVFVPLLVWAALKEDTPPPGRSWRRLGIALVVAGLAAQLLAAKAANLSLGRYPAMGALAGILVAKGIASPRTTALALFIVPFPYFMTYELGGETLMDLWFAAALGLLSPLQLGFEVAFEWHFVRVDGLRLEILPVYSALPLLAHLLGLTWYWALRTGRGVRVTLPGFAVAAIAAPLLQIALIAVALGALAAGSLAASEAILAFAPWLLPLPIALYLAEAKRG